MVLITRLFSMLEKLANIYHLSLMLLLRIYVFVSKISKIVSCIIYSSLYVVPLDSLSRKCMFRHQNQKPKMLRSRDIARCEPKIVAILKFQDGRPRVFRKNVNITFQVQ